MKEVGEMGAENAMGFKDKYNEYLNTVNQALCTYIVEKDTPEATIYRAMKYSLLAGGKRLRPVLSLAVGEMLGMDAGDVLPYACALEMIHTYSLIHDDLPAMDNDDYRRGRLTNHKVFGEAMAILAGDALLTYAFEIVTRDLQLSAAKGHISGKAAAAACIANCAGTAGMIGGQVVDLESEGKAISAELLKYMHKCKTGALIKAAVVIPAEIAGVETEVKEQLVLFAENLGLAFQIKDDLLDVEGNLEAMGKAAGSDAARNKSTYVTLYGVEKSKAMLADTTENAVRALDGFGVRGLFLKELAYHLLKRDH